MKVNIKTSETGDGQLGGIAEYINNIGLTKFSRTAIPVFLFHISPSAIILKQIPSVVINSQGVVAVSIENPRPLWVDRLPSPVVEWGERDGLLVSSNNKQLYHIRFFLLYGEVRPLALGAPLIKFDRVWGVRALDRSCRGVAVPLETCPQYFSPIREPQAAVVPSINNPNPLSIDSLSNSVINCFCVGALPPYQIITTNHTAERRKHLG